MSSLLEERYLTVPKTFLINFYEVNFFTHNITLNERLLLIFQ